MIKPFHKLNIALVLLTIAPFVFIFADIKLNGAISFYIPLKLLVATYFVVLSIYISKLRKELPVRIVKYLRYKEILTTSNIVFALLLIVASVVQIVLGNNSYIKDSLGFDIGSQFGIGTVLFVALFIFGFSKLINNRELIHYFAENTLENVKNNIDIRIIVIFIIYVLISVFVLVHYNGSYIDEYLHIFSGKELLTTGHLASIYDQVPYTRGWYVSLAAGIMYKLFGYNLLAFKFIPLVIGIICWYLLYEIAKHIFKTKPVNVIFTMIVYSFSYLILLNHFYLRFYVFYELFILLSAFAWLKVFIYFNANKNKKLALLIVGLTIFNLVVYFGDKDGGRISISFFNLIFYISFLISFYRKFIETTTIRFIKQNVKVITIALTIGVVLVMLFLFSFLGFIRAFNDIFSSPAQISDTARLYLYDNLFYQDYFALTVFFIIGVVGSIVLGFKNKIPKYLRTLTLAVGLLFVAHLSFSPSLQITRGVIYLLPLYFLIAVLGSSFITKKRFAIILSFLVIGANLINQYPQNFINNLSIPNEVNYMDYSRAYSTLQTLCKDRIIYNATASAFISDFYGVKSNYVLYQSIYLDAQYTGSLFYFDESINQFKTNYLDLVVARSSTSIINDLSLNNKICVVVVPFYYWEFISKTDYVIIDSKMGKLTFQNLTVYYN